MDAIGTFIDRGDPGIPIGLFQPIFAQIAIAAQNLHTQFSRLDACLGAINLGNWGQEIDQVGGRFRFHGDKSQMRQAAPTDRQPVDLIQHAADVGMLVQGHGAAVRAAPLHALGGIGAGDIIRPRRVGDALQGHVQPGVVHHGEHSHQPLAFCADQLGLGPVKGQLAGGRGVQPHLFLDPRHDN